MPAPAVPTIPAAQPLSGSTTTLEIAVLANSDGTAIAAPSWTLLPDPSGIQLTLAGADAAYQAYASSGSTVWDSNVKVGMSGTLAFKTSGPAADPVLAPLVQAGLSSGNAALIGFRLREADNSYWSGVSHVTVTPMTPERGVRTLDFTGKTTGKVDFTPGT